jgi:hypothetical protein
MSEFSESLNRTVKLALDDGSATSLEEAIERFRGFRVGIDVREGTMKSPGLEATLLTLLNAAPRTFLGGVEVFGDVDQLLHLAWFNGTTIKEAALSFGATVGSGRNMHSPVFVLGPGPLSHRDFVLSVQCADFGFRLSPEAAEPSSVRSSVECGLAAAGAALNEAFHHLYRGSPFAGQRSIAFGLPLAESAPAARSLWAIGLGHLGQAALWSLALRPHSRPCFVRLQDPDRVTASSLSTCLLASPQDVGRLKVDVVADKLERLGIGCSRIDRTLTLNRSAVAVEENMTLVAVDNVALRRSLDAISGCAVVEAGIGDGTDGFTRVQLHVLPGPRKAADIWADGDPRASKTVNITPPAYQALLAKTKDECGTTLLAGKSIATPFIGAFAGAVMAVIGSALPRTQWDWSMDVNSLG